MVDYCTITQVQDWLKGLDVNVVTTDPELIRMIAKAKDAINRATRMAFEPTPATERYDGKGQQKLILDHWPIISLVSAKIYNMNNQLIRTLVEADLILEKPIGAITIPPSTYWLMPTYTSSFYFWPYTAYMGSALRSSEYDYYNKFGVGIANIAVEYTYGYATAPAAINEAAIKMVVIELLSKKGISQTQGTSSTSIVGITETYGQSGSEGGSGPFKALIDQYQKDIDANLKGYTSKPVRVI